ncbi:hypothetical protein ABZ953_35010 [Streptomyces sp. NPDC046465]|uniref:hypothetical protein n=1 Tax=Streptomyces sp. NPDC046465 TaxID=3155810 RepID=UPI0033EFF535
MRATRRTFRTAAIATGAIAALAVPTTAAFAADAPSTPQGQVAQDDQPGKDQDQDQGQDKSTDETGKKDDTGQDKSTDKAKAKDTDKDADNDADKDKPVPGGWESKGTTNLGHGWSAKVDVNASARTAKATITKDGAAKGSLTAYEKSATTSIDGSTFTLSPDGTVTAKIVEKDRDKDKDKPVPGGWESKGTTNLGHGWSAKVDVNASARTAKAAISLNGKAKGSLTAYEKSATTKIDGNTFTLTPSGAVTMQTKPTPPKPKPQPKPKPKPQPAHDTHRGSDRTVPRGGVKAGADGVKPASDDAPLIAAGGGMAAVGAAGLGFALYRRKQNG